MKKTLLIIVILGLVFTFFFMNVNATAQDYLNLGVKIYSDGDSFVTGSASLDPGLEYIDFDQETLAGITPSLTSKEKEVWNFHVIIEKNYEKYYAEIILPENSALKADSIKTDTSSDPVITTQDDLVVLEFLGSGSIDIYFEYELNKSQDSDSGWIYLILAILIILIILIWFLIKRKLKTKRKKTEKKERKQEKSPKEKSKKKARTKSGIKKKSKRKSKIEIIKKTLNEREKLIVNTLIKEKGKSTQGKLQKLSGIPKASFSRHLNNLSKKGLIIKHGKGRLNVVKLKK